MKRVLSYLFVSIVFFGCSTEKNAFMNRFYHNVTAKYNAYFHGYENLKMAEKTLRTDHPDNFDEIIDVFPYGTDQSSKSVYPQLEIAIKKGTKVIDRHSMRFRVKRKEVEVNNWVPDSYFMIAKSYYLKREYGLAKETFEYIVKEYDYDEIRYDGLIWLVKTYIELEEFEEAEKKIDLIKNIKEFPKKKKWEYYATKGQYAIDTEDYPLAIESLVEALKHTKKKRIKTRLNYVLAQLYLQEGNSEKATQSFMAVVKGNPNYTMEFNARIQMAMAFKEGQSSEELIKGLLKMAKDDKNKEYKDQIYYAIAEIYSKDNNQEEAEKNYKLSAASSVNNAKQKSLAFLALANMNFEDGHYVPAQAYYDSAAAFLPKEHPSYERVLVKKNSLTKLVEQITIIETEDSLQILANLPEDQRLERIERTIENIVENEEREKEIAELKRNAANDVGGGINAGQNSSGKWYFYNPSVMAFGKAEFRTLWGDRALEDNWRRKNKASLDFFDTGNSEDGVGGIVSEEDKKKTKEYYLEALPLTDEAMEASKKRMVDAYYKLGNIYKDNLNDNAKVIETFEEMNMKFPLNDNLLKSYYILYRTSSVIDDQPRAKKYKDLITIQYPNSEYAYLINNEGKNIDTEASKKAVENTYQQLMMSFKQGNYETVIAGTKQLNLQHPKSHLSAKAELLKAMSIGYSQGPEQFKIALEKLIESYPETDEEKEAEAILKRIKDKEDHSKQAELDRQKELDKFVKDEKELHFHILIISENADLNKVQNSVSDYAADYYGLEGLEVTSMIWGEGKKAIVVKSFARLETALNYHEGFKEKVIDKNQLGNTYFPISKSNYTKLFKKKNVEEYYSFFVENYIEQKEE